MGRRRFRLRAGSRCAISECLGCGDREDGYSRSSGGGKRNRQRDLCEVDSPAIWTGRVFAEEGELCFAGGGAAAGRDPRGDSYPHRKNRGRSADRFLWLLPDGEPSGGNGEKGSRFISSTSRNLEKEVEAGRFRRELYFRINGVILRLPPLRERKEDMPALLEYFLAKHSNELKKDAPELSSDARELMASYDWPGNIRELGNLAKKIVAVGDPMLALGDLRATYAGAPVTSEGPHVSSLKVAARAASRRTERELILKALEPTHWNRKRAARELQISYKSLLYKIKQIGVQGSEAGEV